MANTINTSIAAVQASLGFWTPTVGAASLEPALSAANMVQQVMTSPPFRFPWNRNSLAFPTIVGTQDYTQSVTDFGYIETATIQLPASGRIFSLNVKNTTPLGESSDQQQPTTLGVQINTVGTSVKLRFLGVPDKIYTVVVWYQKFAANLAALANPLIIPDYMAYIFNRGFLAHLYEARGDQRAQQEKVAFAGALLATSEGLTDTEVNMFLAQYLANPRAMESLQAKTQQGVQARGGI